MEIEDPESKHDDEGVDDDDRDDEGPKSYHPDEQLANHELPKWCRYPEPIPFDSQDEAGCQDTVTGSSELMDRYLVRRMAQIIKPMHTSYHQTSIAKFRATFARKRLDVMSDFTNGVHNGFNDDDMPNDPTDQQMEEFAESHATRRADDWETCTTDKRAFDRWRSVLEKEQSRNWWTNMKAMENMSWTAGGSLFNPVSLLRSKDLRLKQRHQAIVLKHKNEKETERKRSMVTPVDEHGNKPTDMLVTGSQ